MNKPKPIKVNYFEPTERARKNPRNINALMFIYERVKPHWGYPIDPVKKLLSPYLMEDLIDDLNEAGHRAPRGGEFTSMQVYRLLDRLHWIADFYDLKKKINIAPNINLFANEKLLLFITPFQF